MHSRATLSFDRQVTILKRFAQLADGTDVYAREMVAKGYRSFLAWEEFEQSFCAIDELDSHYSGRIERLKRNIESPDGLWLRSERDAPIDDPCANRRRETALSDNATFEGRRGKLYQAFTQYRAEELNILGTRLKKNTAADFGELYTSVISEVFSPLGFCLDSDRSKALFPVVSKPLNSEWDICWSPESPRTLRHEPLPSQSSEARQQRHLDLHCYVCGRRRRGYAFIPIGFKSLNLMEIRVQSIQYGFAWAYALYDGIEEFELVVGAHAFLYGLVSERTESILRSELGR